MICSPKIEYIATSMANAATMWGFASTGLHTASASYEVFLGETETDSTPTTTTTNERINSTLAPGALNDAIVQVTTGSSASGSAKAVTGMSAPSINITAWTSTTTVAIDISLGMVASAALTSGKKYSTMVCYKLGASEFQCATATVTGAVGAGYGSITWKAYGSATAPAASDFSSVTAQHPDHSTVLG